jgi:hypothetical protein
LDAQVTVPKLPAGTHRIAVGEGSGHTITIPSEASPQTPETRDQRPETRTRSER